MTDLRDVYGTCAAEPCMCRRVSWLGRMCQHWRPMGPKDQPELAMWHRAASTTAPAPPMVAETEEKQNANR